MPIHRPLDVMVEIIACDKNGKVERVRRFRSKSFVQNFIDIMLYGIMRPTASAGAMGVTGRSVSGVWEGLTRSTNETMTLPTAIITTGADIVVGTGSTVVATADYQMVGRAGRAQATLSTPVTNGLTRSFTLTATIAFATATTINETGIELPMLLGSASLALTLLMIRDIISGGFAVSAGGAITIVYTISITS